ncbi:MAG: acyltransferase [Azonexus sp.]|nr:acyltransferase [Azonexus sp.]
MTPTAAASADTSLTYRPDIDGLRAIAVLGVLLFHGFPGLLPGGFAGVDVFFVISGYLITGILAGDCRQGRFSLIRFYGKRIRRIFPALLLCLATAWGLGYAILTPSEFKELGRSLIHSTFFANNFLLVSQAGYFDTQADLKPLLHLWSLSVEEQFYIVWPWVIYLVFRFARVGKWMIALSGVASVLACLMFTVDRPVEAFFLPQYRAWELMLGAVVALHGARLHTLLSRLLPAAWFAPLGVLLIAGTYVGISGSDPFPGWRAMLPTAGAALIILSRPDAPFSRSVMASGPAVAIGLISYPLYLWHWLVLSYARILFDHLAAPVLAGLLLLSIALAWATYRFVETPLRHGHWSPRAQRALPALGLMLLILLGGLGDHTRSQQGFPARLPGNDWKDLLWPADYVLDPQCMQALKLAGNYCQRTHEGPLTHALLGDSHANHFFPGLSHTLSQTQGNLLQLQGPMQAAQDPAWDNIAFLNAHPEIRTVYIAYHQGRMKEADNPFNGILDTTIQRLLDGGKRVIFIIDNPAFDFDPRLNVQRPPFAEWLVGHRDKTAQSTESLDYLQRKRRDYTDYLAGLKQRFPSLAVLDAFSPLCDSQRCSALDDQGRLIFRDHHHLTRDGSLLLFGRLQSAVENGSR